MFNQNKREIIEHNNLYAQRLVLYKKGINKYSDLTEDAFNEKKGMKSSSR